MTQIELILKLKLRFRVQYLVQCDYNATTNFVKFFQSFFLVFMRHERNPHYFPESLFAIEIYGVAATVIEINLLGSFFSTF